MARIRTVKPEFFQHEKLQDLEAEHPGQYIMLVFAGLWTQCDAQGVFIWKPRSLKLHILPFLQYDLETTLQLLEQHGFVEKYTDQQGQQYGRVTTFEKHQRLSGKEVTTGQRYPLKTTGQQQGSDGEAIEKYPDAQERKGKERKGTDTHAPAPARENPEPTPTPPPPPARPDTLPQAIEQGKAWAQTEQGKAQVEAMRQAATYSPEKYQNGSIPEQIAGLLAYYWKTPNTQAQIKHDVGAYITQNLCTWLIKAKSMNKPATDHTCKPAQQYTPPPQRNLEDDYHLTENQVRQLIQTHAPLYQGQFTQNHINSLRKKSTSRSAIELIGFLCKNLQPDNFTAVQPAFTTHTAATA